MFRLLSDPSPDFLYANEFITQKVYKMKHYNRFPAKFHIKMILENPGIDPGTSHMLSERSTI